MNLKNLYLAHAVVGGLFGLILVLMPGDLLGFLGVVMLPKSVLLLARLLGAFLLGMATISWFSQELRSKDARTLAVGHVVADAIAFIVALLAQLDGVTNALGWGVVVVFLLFGSAFGYFGVLKKG